MGYVAAGIGAAIGWIGANAAAIGAIASIASTAYTMTQSPGDMGSIEQAPIEIGNTANPIDKTSMQNDSELGKLQLGEEEMDKAKRKKGKAAFKIALAEDEKKKEGAGGESATGVQVAKPDAVGAQL